MHNYTYQFAKRLAVSGECHIRSALELLHLSAVLPLSFLLLRQLLPKSLQHLFLLHLQCLNLLVLLLGQLQLRAEMSHPFNRGTLWCVCR